jgi:putative ABC transport system permease protein
MLGQLVIVSVLNFRNLRHRFWESLVIVIGMACVSGVLLSMLSMTEGLLDAYHRNVDPRTVIVVARAAVWENASSIPRDQARIVMSAPGIATASDGQPVADAGVIAWVPARFKKNGGITTIPLRTFGPKGAMLRPNFHIVAGRMFRPGAHELIAGAMAGSRYAGMALGDKVILPDGEWPIVGIFQTGDLLDGQLVGDTESVMPTLRHKAFNSVLARLQSPAAYTTFRRAMTANPLLTVDVMPLADWNARASSQFVAFSRIIVYGAGSILAVGALFGCFNTMYAAVESRGREIATLRALGYGGLPIAASVILEAAALAVAGALIGAAMAWLLYDGVESGWGDTAFRLVVSPAMAGIGVLWAMVVALLGGLMPSIQAARWSVAEALRAR